MSIINRQTIVFFLPLDIEALASTFSPFSTITENNPFPELGDSGATWDKRQLYMNPQSFQIRDQKLIQKQLTKGGHMVQYWGEELPQIDVGGTTGSAGIEGINVLKNIYRHEQLHYRNILAQRHRAMALAAAQAAANAEGQLYDTGDGFGVLAGVGDALTGGAVSKIGKGLSNSVDILFGTSVGEDFGGSAKAIKTAPTLAAFATSVDMFFQGEFFRGYFNSFSTTESAQEPGHFNYNFTFIVTRRSGKRDNFMPWHRNPVSFDGETAMSQPTTEAKGSWPGVETLSFAADPKTWKGDNRTYYDMLEDEANAVESFFTDHYGPKEDDNPNVVPDRRKILKP